MKPNPVRWQEFLPVLISIAVIVAVAFLQRQSKLAAAITVTMPLTAPLALWIVYSSSSGDRQAVNQFTQGMLIDIVPTIGFLIAVWQASRAGFTLIPTLLIGYGTWGIGVLIILGLRRILSMLHSHHWRKQMVLTMHFQRLCSR